MSGLISNLATGSKALSVQSKGLEIAGKNLANINNRNYAKQRVEIGDRGSINTGIATESMGVEAMELRQNRDALLDKSVMREFTASSGLEAAKKVLESAENALGQFLDRTKDSTSIQNANGASGGGMSDALTDFFNAWESFSVKPNDTGVKQLLIAKAQILSDKINATDKNLKQVQTDAGNQLLTDVGVVNGILAEIAKTNEYIAKAELVKPYSAVDLRDQRQAKLEELSKYIDVSFGPIETIPATTPPTIDPNGLGQIDVKSNGVSLISGKTVLGVYKYDATDKLSWDATNNSNDKIFTSADLPQGKIGAQILASTGDVKTARDSISTLATNLINQVNAHYAIAVPATEFFLTPTAPDARLIQFNETVVNADTLKAAASIGGNKQALDIAALATEAISTLGTNVTFNSHFNKTVTTLAQELNTTNIRLEDQKLSEEMARSSRDEFSGVSQDEELTDLMKFQRSFQATSRFINVVDNLLDQVVNRMGSF
jgi:flagellar hook-associated protein 1 FlgK